MTTIVYIITLCAGLILLARGADRFVNHAGMAATRLGIPPMVVGLTIVALGTSAPEAAISVAAALQSSAELSISNVFGSNIVNMLVVLGTTALMGNMPVRRQTIRRELPFVCAITAMLLVLCAFDGTLDRHDALLFLALLVGYLVHMVRSAKAEPKAAAQTEPDGMAQAERPERPLSSLVVGALFGMATIALGAHLAVEGATALALSLGMPERVLGLTVIALGTSLPELVTSLTAARKGHTDIAIGNVVGSSILNILFVLGLSGVIAPIPFAQELLFDGLVALGAAALLWLLCLRRGSLGRGGGLVLLGTYGTYTLALLA